MGDVISIDTESNKAIAAEMNMELWAAYNRLKQELEQRMGFLMTRLDPNEGPDSITDMVEYVSYNEIILAYLKHVPELRTRRYLDEAIALAQRQYSMKGMNYIIGCLNRLLIAQRDFFNLGAYPHKGARGDLGYALRVTMDQLLEYISSNREPA
jgi:hypothetical protein